jgi:hypothetical protein
MLDACGLFFLKKTRKKKNKIDYFLSLRTELRVEPREVGTGFFFFKTIKVLKK